MPTTGASSRLVRVREMMTARALLPPPCRAVNGASGYIGSHICLTLVKKGYHVRACVRNPEDYAKVNHLRMMNGASESDAAPAGCCKCWLLAAACPARACARACRSAGQQ